MLEEVIDWSVIWEAAQADGQALAMWRLPNQTQQYLLQDSTGGVVVDPHELENLGAGFLVGPFIGQPYFLKATKLISKKSTEEALASTATFHPSLDHEKREEFVDQVARSVKKIEAGHFQKVVLSRIDEQEITSDFDLLRSFEQLCANYPHAFVAAIYVPALGDVWLCATPETLVSQDAEGIFRTISLAGTQAGLDSAGNKLLPSEARWSQKEIEEQAYVSRYIIDCFKKIRLREYHENGPKTVLAGNLMHLKTEYWVDTTRYHYPGLITQMLNLLHPTSAVCGTPKDAALDWILATERHERSLYSGYLGPINLNQTTHLFVNLRTVQLQGKIARYYAGCGITEDSDPEKEWQETQMKCQTLQRVINASL
jgi:isochorismate synthase